MRPVMNHLSISAARTDALFVSTLQRSDEPIARQIRQSVAVAVHQFGSRGCAARVAQIMTSQAADRGDDRRAGLRPDSRRRLAARRV